MTLPVTLGRFAPPLDVRSVTYRLAGLLVLAAPCLLPPAGVALVAAAGYLPHAGVGDAVFEALSGFTTTGLTAMAEDTLPASVAFFRAFSQWLGGAGIAIIYLAALAGPRSAASRLYMAEFEEGNVPGNVVSAARAVAVVYGGLTLAGYALLAAGAGPGDGLLHAFSLLSTGGFSPFPDSVGAYDSPAIGAVTVVFMVVASVASCWRTSRPLAVASWS